MTYEEMGRREAAANRDKNELHSVFHDMGRGDVLECAISNARECIAKRTPSLTLRWIAIGGMRSLVRMKRRNSGGATPGALLIKYCEFSAGGGGWDGQDFAYDWWLHGRLRAVEVLYDYDFASFVTRLKPGDVAQQM